MKKAVIVAGGKQYLVAVGETITVDLVKDAGKTVSFAPIMVLDGDKTEVGSPEVKGVTVKATVVEADVKGEKTVAIRYKAKKRVHKVHGNRQRQTILKIDSIA